MLTPSSLTLTLALLLGMGAATPVAAMPAGCSAADPAIVDVHVIGTTHEGGLDHILVGGRVQNIGSEGQPGNVLQRVDYYLNGNRTYTKTIQPLPAGGSQNFSFTVERAAGAGMGTSKVSFVLQVLSPEGQRYDCNLANDRAELHI